MADRYRLRFAKENLAVRANVLRMPLLHEQHEVRRSFILGSGRSGTTILGQVLSGHPDVTYAFEPKGRWAAVDERTDVWRRYWPWRGGQLLGEQDVSDKTGTRFRKLFQAATPMFLDKSPEHAFRLPYLKRLAPGARFVHIVRDGLEVARSIAEFSRTEHPLVGRHSYNDWWGLDHAKWEFLGRVASTRKYLAAEASAAADDLERGLCEWLISLNEVRQARDVLGEDLLEVRFDDLVTDPSGTLQAVAAHIGISAEAEWLDRAVMAIRAPAPRGSIVQHLPAALDDELQRAREEWGLSPRCPEPR